MRSAGLGASQQHLICEGYPNVELTCYPEKEMQPYDAP
jgi:hypothetical protein